MPLIGSLRENHYLDFLLGIGVERQQLAHQRKRYAGRRSHIQVLELPVHIGAVIVLLKNAVFFFKIEQSPRRDSDDEFVF